MGLAKRIIPCLDVDGGRVVKGVRFVDIRDAGDPVEIARRYDREGADEITFLDITASSEQRDTMVRVMEQVAAEVFIPLTVGGGIRSVEDVRRMLHAGADKVSINTAAVFTPTLSAPASSIAAASSNERTPPPTERGMDSTRRMRRVVSRHARRPSVVADTSSMTSSSAPSAA